MKAEKCNFNSKERTEKKCSKLRLAAKLQCCNRTSHLDAAAMKQQYSALVPTAAW